VQAMSFSDCSEYLVSNAGYCDNSVCVWDILSGEMVSGIHDLSKINDISCRRLNTKKPRHLLEFVTGGKEVLNVQQLTKKKNKKVLMS